MIMDNFTAIPNNSSVVEYLFAFDIGLGRVAIFSVLMAITLVMAASIFIWKRDFLDSALYALFNANFMGFVAYFIVSKVFLDANGVPMRLLGFGMITPFIVLAALVLMAKKWGDV